MQCRQLSHSHGPERGSQRFAGRAFGSGLLRTGGEVEELLSGSLHNIRIDPGLSADEF